MTNILQLIAQNLLENKTTNIDIDNEFDLETFSKDISLFGYQQEALRYGISILELYFRDKQRLVEYYENKGFNENDFKKEKLTIDKLLNRASFWMATGSGKSIVMIKLIEILKQMSEKEYIPANDILILAPTQKILEQLKAQVALFNTYSHTKIDLISLKEYERVKRQGNLFTQNHMQVFYYRSDLFTDAEGVGKKKDGKRINYENYLGDKSWYIILDEAHKGDAEKSLKKEYYNTLAENGYIFNFSATFTDNIDKLTTVYNFNLAKFNEKGYGKNIKIVDEEFKGFNKKEEDLSSADKKDVLLKSLILFSAIKKEYKALKKLDRKLYHNPLMIAVAHTVNIKNADLKIYFQTLLEVAKEEPEEFKQCKQGLISNLNNNRDYFFGDETVSDDFIDLLRDVKYKDLLLYLFNTKSNGTIECIKTKDSSELLFKLKTSSEPFALLKISDTKSWSNGLLYNYDISEDMTKEGYFKRLNDEDSTINVLLGSRVFSEGWDSNRPNIVSFLNIGSSSAKKYVMQTIGRGVRIEPLPNERKRYRYLDYEKIKNIKNTSMIEEYNSGIESIFVFATSKNDVENVFKEIEEQKDEFERLEGIRKLKHINMPLLIPKYVQRIKAEEELLKYKIPHSTFARLKDFINSNDMDIILMNLIGKCKNKNLALHTFSKIQNNPDKFFTFNDMNDVGLNEIDLIVKTDKFFESKLAKVEEFVELTDEITHYKEIKVNIKKVKQKDLDVIKEDIKNAKLDIEQKKEELKDALARGEIDIDKVMEETERLGSSKPKTTLLDIRNLKKHYYHPLLLKTDNDYFKNIIDEESEIEFINNLERYLKKDDNKLKNYDSWYFSKLSENIDKIYIPYIDSQKSKLSKFYPDFIFWLQKGNNYKILFIDPHGLQSGRDNTIDKTEGFERIFLNNKFLKDNLNIEIKLIWYYQDSVKEALLEKYREWDFENLL
jgi:superfamily II DNA or RNA helicase